MTALPTPDPAPDCPARHPAGQPAAAAARVGFANGPELPGELSPQDYGALCALAGRARHLDKGSRLFDLGAPLGSLYQVAEGAFKTCISAQDGRTQVVGFHLPGDWLGLDGIDTGRHALDAMALEEARVWMIDYGALQRLLSQSVTLQHAFHRMMSREIQREAAMLRLLGRLPADARLACFLLDQAHRLPPIGPGHDAASGSELVLHMSREDIGSYLGLQIETISRSLSKLKQDGVLAVHHRHVHLLDRQALQRLAQGDELVGVASVQAPLPPGP
jgi:CRP/FNR family transcriptional regulator